MPISSANQRIVLILPRSLVAQIREHQVAACDQKRVGQFLREQLPGWLQESQQIERIRTIEEKFERLIDALDVGFERVDSLTDGIDTLIDELQLRRVESEKTS